MPDSTVYTELDDFEVTGSRTRQLERGGSMDLSKGRISEGVHVFGEADAIKLISGQAGVQTAGTYGSGLMIDGNEVSHVLYTIDKVPVLFPFRFGGIFSTFNNNHFRKVEFYRGFHNASKSSRLGAVFDFRVPGNIPSSAEGDINIGLLSSSASVRIPVQNVWLGISARVSYIDQLYGALFTGSTGVKYNFQDLNFTTGYNPDSNNSLIFNFFGSNDRLNYDDSNYVLDTFLDWNNVAGSLSWIHTGTLDSKMRVYYSGFFSRLKFSMPQFGISSPTFLQSYGFSGELEKIIKNDRLNLSAGYEFNCYLNQIQKLEVTGFNSSSASENHYMKPIEARVYIDSEFKFSGGIKLSAGLSTSYYRNSDSYTHFSADPRFTLSVPLGVGNLNIHAGSYSQYIHQVGFSQIGLASDFWITSKKNIPAQKALSFELDYSGFLESAALYYSASIYWRRILHQPEYRGDLFSILDSDYDVADYISVENGFNTGFNIFLRKNIGTVTGGIGLGYGIARRRLDNYNKYIRGRSEPGFIFNAEATWHVNEKWDIGGRFKFSSGRPYTPVLSAYMIAGNLISEYGVPNSSLLPAWHSLDLSATLKLYSGPESHPLKHLINFGIINAYGRKNVEFMTYQINIKEGKFELKKVSSLYRFLPTLNYTLEF